MVKCVLGSWLHTSCIKVALGVALLVSGHQGAAAEESVDFGLRPMGQSDAQGRAAVEAYIRERAEKIGVQKDLGNLKFVKVQTSLLGRHYRYQQVISETPVKDGGLIVSVLSGDEVVYRMANNMKKVTEKVTSKSLLSNQGAYDRAWNYLGVNGELLHEPKVESYFRVFGNKALPVMAVHLALTSPYGFWVVELDATNGDVISLEDQRLDNRPRDPAVKRAFVREGGKRALVSREAAFAQYRRKVQSQKAKVSLSESRDGDAMVFDPDPRTALRLYELEDDSPADAFDEAYILRPLRDLKFINGKYHLSGPWVEVADFDPPTNAPSTSTTGQWRAKRGSNNFNDAMTYFHIDQSQRYMQRLGFVGERAIQYGPIRVDTDGANGADNSYFQPSTNSLSFGHGCVDDNEDADVILHEYGHAIQHSINPSWYGGDTGAMGEGFGDYWAGSYSFSTEDGRAFRPDEIFTWDAHGPNGSCWPGRVMNASSLRYNPAQTYGAHQPLPSGFQSDELWSTPLFQSLRRLTELGVAREDVDKVVLESHFGLGSGMSMRQMAEATIQAATLLFVGGPHADVFADLFTHHGIIELPHVAFSPQLEVKNPGANGVADPGETLDLNLVLRNSGTMAASSIFGALRSIKGATVLAGESTWPDLNLGESASNQQGLKIKLDDITCGEQAELSLEVSYGEGDPLSYNLWIDTGVAIGAQQQVQVDAPIPDNDSAGLFAPLQIPDEGHAVTENLKVRVQLKHTYINDLTLTLISPSGVEVKLHDRTGGGNDNIEGVYGADLPSAEPLSKLIGEPLGGQWRLKVADHAPIDTGELVSWGIEDVIGYQCDSSR